MSGQDPPILVIDGEVQFELTEKTSYLPLMMSMANNSQHDLAHVLWWIFVT
jgi:hypothetical protein